MSETVEAAVARPIRDDELAEVGGGAGGVESLAALQGTCTGSAEADAIADLERLTGRYGQSVEASTNLIKDVSGTLKSAARRN